MADGEREEEHDGPEEDVEAEAQVDFKPLIELPPEVQTKTGEEEEDVIFKMRTKMFRFNEPSKEWKERGTGDVRFLKHKESGKIRVLMRAEKTLRVRANHPLSTNLELKPHAGSDRAFTYFTPDWSEDPETGVVEQKNELFAFRFANAESANKFKEAFEKCKKGDTADMTVIKQDAEDAEKAAEKKEDKKE
ncbi:hypothetical protein GUITHDRAFT_154835 [Guillardia theta CCMP2712]|uniref:Ran-specific GTPase-activating protein n=1 Tax=Guillardia theta (strain CCMP2712) TaxID=905079 RepID=L1INV5_GUITC|nr:hypothetical protein GUITHDRAFT_154835 [Guillardia theta CCMP2712]EKX37971.1 hypothetical protein GUITHDRAFT_154835 [Guillardia theta CCMP2712]|eukprot:XP_005824951.1 hypothetical protein GUITHDRAFT_154835 [Guillardia theta CCMP2712]